MNICLFFIFAAQLISNYFVLLKKMDNGTQKRHEREL